MPGFAESIMFKLHDDGDGKGIVELGGVDIIKRNAGLGEGACGGGGDVIMMSVDIAAVPVADVMAEAHALDVDGAHPRHFFRTRSTC